MRGRQHSMAGEAGVGVGSGVVIFYFIFFFFGFVGEGVDGMGGTDLGNSRGRGC